jgi:hypothetical protein
MMGAGRKACYNKDMIFEMLRWWYVTGWLEAVHRIGSWVKGMERTFSLTLLAQTLFSPWRRIVTPPGKGIDAQMRAAADNFVSRCVGFAIRFFVILAALVSIAVALVLGVVMAAIWPLLPVLIFVAAFKGLTA